jgi:phosphotransferase system enzyme I (PtsI)
MMLEDEDYNDQLSERVREKRENIEWVIYDNAQALIQMMQSSPDPTFRERATDIRDVTRRVLSHLLSIERVSLSDLDRDVILVAHDLLPSETLTMNRNHVKGIVMDMGGSTSHVAILARSFNIPAVLGLSSASTEIKNNDVLVINAEAGEVYINPEQKDLDKWKKAEAKYSKKENEFLRTSDRPAETKDGHKVLLKANIGIRSRRHRPFPHRISFS